MLGMMISYCGSDDSKLRSKTLKAIFKTRILENIS